MANNGLDDQTGYGGRNPKYGDLTNIRTKCLKYATYIGQLERPAKLDPKESKTHVPYLPEAKSRFVFHQQLNKIT